jgi:hypothetical protein
VLEKIYLEVIVGVYGIKKDTKIGKFTRIFKTYFVAQYHIVFDFWKQNISISQKESTGKIFVNPIRDVLFVGF